MSTPAQSSSSPSLRVPMRGKKSSPGARKRGGTLLSLLEAYAMLLLLIAVAVFFSIWGETSSTFPTAANFRIVLAGQAVIGVVALAALIPLTANEWDLSVGAIAGLSSVFCASALSTGTPILVVVFIGAFIGIGVGAVNAFLITRVRTNAVITTLGTAAIVGGAITHKTGGVALVSNIPDAVISFGSGTWLGIPRVAYVLALVSAIVYYMLNYTPLGRYFYALGSNRSAARLVGIRANGVLGVVFLCSGLLAGLAGVLQVAYAGGADPRTGDSLTLPALAAAFLSAAAIRPGRYNVLGTLVAIYFLATINSGLSQAGAPQYVSQYVNGAALIAGVALAVYFGRRRGLDRSDG